MPTLFYGPEAPADSFWTPQGTYVPPEDFKEPDYVSLPYTPQVTRTTTTTARRPASTSPAPSGDIKTMDEDQIAKAATFQNWYLLGAVVLVVYFMTRGK